AAKAVLLMIASVRTGSQPSRVDGKYSPQWVTARERRVGIFGNPSTTTSLGVGTRLSCIPIRPPTTSKSIRANFSTIPPLSASDRPRQSALLQLFYPGVVAQLR